MEMGRRWNAENLPKTNWSLANWLWLPQVGLRGFFNISLFKRIIVLHGNAVGGGSITYASVLLVPPDRAWEQGSWVGLNDWKAVMPAHYATAQSMLGVTKNRLLRAGPSLREIGQSHRRGKFLLHHPRGHLFWPGRRCPGHDPRPDPYFSGEFAFGLHRLRRLHGGLPAQRQKYTGQKLSVSG